MATPSSNSYVNIGNPISISIERLSATNWQSWKTRISGIINANKWRKYIDGTSIPPAALGATTPALTAETALTTPESFEEGDTSPRAKWFEMDQIVMLHLTSAISDQQLQLIGSVTTSTQLWRCLHDLKEPTGLSTITNSLATILHARCTDESQIDYHLTKIRNNSIELAELGESFPDRYLAAIYMQSLPPSYKSFVDSFWGMQPSSDLKSIKSEDVMSRILGEFRRRQSDKERNDWELVNHAVACGK
jgi:hypothetical protein